MTRRAIHTSYAHHARSHLHTPVTFGSAVIKSRQAGVGFTLRGPEPCPLVSCLLTVPRSPASPYSPKPKSITMGIDEIKPRQLAPSVGIGGADCVIVTVPTKAIYNSAAMESHLLFGAFDFTAHSPATLKDFEPVGDGLEILFGSFYFQVGKPGPLRLPERVPLPSIRPASWAPQPVLRTSPSTDES